MSPSPGTDHQNASRHIQFALYEQIEKQGRGQVFDAPMDLELAPTDVVQPDLIVVLAEHKEIVLPARLRGVPDLLVEILSPSTTDRDLTLKRILYQSHGVPEYWVVNTNEHLIQRYRLREGRYGDSETVREQIEFAGAVVDLKMVWAQL
jgi:Uma2 family endonuclease